MKKIHIVTVIFIYLFILGNTVTDIRASVGPSRSCEYDSSQNKYDKKDPAGGHTQKNLSLIEKYINLSYLSKDEKQNNEKVSQLVSAAEYLGPDHEGTISSSSVINKLLANWLNGKVLIEGDYEYVAYNPDPQYTQVKAKYALYDIDKDQSMDLVLLSDESGETQMDVYFPFLLHTVTDDRSVIAPNVTCNYFVEFEDEIISYI